MSTVDSSKNVGGTLGGAATGGVQKTERTDIVTRIGAYKSGFTGTSSQSNAYSSMKMPTSQEIQADIQQLDAKLSHLPGTIKATMDESFDTNLSDMIAADALKDGFNLKLLD